MSFFDDPQIRRNVDRLPIEFDDYGFDRFGLSKDSVARAYSPMAAAYRNYLKVTAFGLENIPARGRGPDRCEPLGRDRLGRRHDHDVVAPQR